MVKKVWDNKEKKMRKKCEVAGCEKYAVDKFNKKWLCRSHLCPEETINYIIGERENIAGLKSSAIQFEETLLDPVEIDDLDDSWCTFLDAETNSNTNPCSSN
jgi:hypothetical protein